MKETVMLESSKPKSLYTTIEEITPERARAFLENAIPNRTLLQRNINRFAADIEEQKWNLNGEAIKVSPAGKLQDGFHRLHACIKANVPFTTVIAWNVSEDTVFSMDTGKARTGADAFTISGDNYGNIRAGAIRWIHKLNPRGGPLDQSTLTITELTEWNQKHPDIQEGLNVFTGGKVVFGAQAVGLWWLLSRIDRVEADRFMTDVRDGINLPSDDPVYIVREKIISMKKSKSRRTQEDTMALLIRAWNLRRQGRSAESKDIRAAYKGQRIPPIEGWTRETGKGIYIEGHGH